MAVVTAGEDTGNQSGNPLNAEVPELLGKPAGAVPAGATAHTQSARHWARLFAEDLQRNTSWATAGCKADGESPTSPKAAYSGKPWQQLIALGRGTPNTEVKTLLRRWYCSLTVGEQVVARLFCQPGRPFRSGRSRQGCSQCQAEVHYFAGFGNSLLRLFLRVPFGGDRVFFTKECQFMLFRGTSSLQRLFRSHFPDLRAGYEQTYASRLGRFRLQRISSAVERFLGCGDYKKDIARIRCTNFDSKADYFRPFSCKVCYPLGGPPHRLCPSCSQKRTLLFGEYMNERLLLLLPHRQIVFTFPKVLRVFFRHDRWLFGKISKLVYRMIRCFYNEAAGRTIHSAALIAYASAGDFARFNPHLHAIFLEGGFDRDGQFVHVPSLKLDKLSQYFRSSMVAFFLKRSLLNEPLARNMLGWAHSGFSVDLSVKIAATSAKAREALAQ